MPPIDIAHVTKPDGSRRYEVRVAGKAVAEFRSFSQAITHARELRSKAS